MRNNLARLAVPNIIALGSHEYKVFFDEREEDGDFNGSFLHRKAEILLNPNVPHHQLRVTFIHELVHAICRVYCVKLEEDDVSPLAEGITEILTRNFGIDFVFSTTPKREYTILSKESEENNAK